MMNYKTKEISIDDFNKFYPIFEKSLFKNYTHIPLKRRKAFLKNKWSQETFKKRYKNKNISIFITEKENEIIAYLVGSVEAGGIGLLRWVWVDKKHRRKGIAGNLIKRLEKWCKKNNCHKLRFITVTENKKFYIKQGFKLEGVRKKDRYKKDQYLFGKILD